MIGAFVVLLTQLVEVAVDFVLAEARVPLRRFNELLDVWRVQRLS